MPIYLIQYWYPNHTEYYYLVAENEEYARDYCRAREDVYFQCKTDYTIEDLEYLGKKDQIIYDPEFKKKEAQSALKRLYDNSSYDLSNYSADKDYETVKKFLEELK